MTYLAGLGSGLSLIVAIGAQNAFVLKQGILRQHVLAVVLFCAVSDAVLIAVGVGGAGLARDRAPWLMGLLTWGGVAFLLWYGARSMWAAWRGGAALRPDGQAQSLWPVLGSIAALTWLNPHVWLDTVVLLGAVSAQWPPPWLFGLGAVTGSFLFFFSLGYGARLVAPLFARPGVWRALELAIALIMWAIAWGIAVRA